MSCITWTCRHYALLLTIGERVESLGDAFHDFSFISIKMTAYCKNPGGWWVATSMSSPNEDILLWFGSYVLHETRICWSHCFPRAFTLFPSTGELRGSKGTPPKGTSSEYIYNAVNSGARPYLALTKQASVFVDPGAKDYSVYYSREWKEGVGR